jgi:hypothetical protein
MQSSQDLVDERLMFSSLLHNKVPPTLLSNLDESVARHVLHTWLSD